jgi:dihydrofolate reductase
MSGAAELVLVAALDRRGGIGKGNALAWHLPDDLKRFKALTLGKPVLMGRKTAQSLGRALPGRMNLVLTRGDSVPFEGMVAVRSLQQACERAGTGELAVIGGGEIYALALPHATRMHLTRVDTEIDGADAFFPDFDEAQWRVTDVASHPADAKHAFAFAFVDYVRR